MLFTMKVKPDSRQKLRRLAVVKKKSMAAVVRELVEGAEAAETGGQERNNDLLIQSGSGI